MLSEEEIQKQFRCLVSAAPGFFLRHPCLPPFLTSVSALRTRWATDKIREQLLCKAPWLKTESCVRVVRMLGCFPTLRSGESGPVFSRCCVLLLGRVWLCAWGPVLLLRAFSGGKLPQDFQQPGFERWEDLVPLPPPVYMFWGPWRPRILAFLKHDGTERPEQLLPMGLGGRWGGLEKLKRAQCSRESGCRFLSCPGRFGNNKSP